MALIALTIAMGLGGAVCSTTGGIKMLRIGVVFKALYNDVKRIMLPESTVFIEKYHHIKDIILEERQVRSAVLIFLCYMGLYSLGGIIGMLFGYPALSSLFESTSAAANVGLSCGITQASMPAALKNYLYPADVGGPLRVYVGLYLNWIFCGLYTRKMKINLSKSGSCPRHGEATRFLENLILLSGIFYLLSSICFAQPLVSSTELIEKAKELDGKEIVYEGEVIGEVMTRGEYSWVNLNDGLNAVGVWMGNDFLGLISFWGL